jgi:hypothetical protein
MPSEIHLPLRPDVRGLLLLSPETNACRNMISHPSGHHLTNEMDPFPIIFPLVLLHCVPMCHASIYVTLFVTGQGNDGRVSERHLSSQLSTH